MSVSYILFLGALGCVLCASLQLSSLCWTLLCLLCKVRSSLSPSAVAHSPLQFASSIFLSLRGSDRTIPVLKTDSFSPGWHRLKTPACLVLGRGDGLKALRNQVFWSQKLSSVASDMAGFPHALLFTSAPLPSRESGSFNPWLLCSDGQAASAGQTVLATFRIGTN